MKKDEIFPQVIIDRNEYNWMAKEVLEEYSKKFKRPIHWHHSHGEIREPIKDDAVHIYPYCSSIVSSRGSDIYYVFGIGLSSGQSNAMHFSENCSREYPVEMLLDNFKNPYGEVPRGANNNLYIHFDLSHAWNVGTRIILCKILDRYFSEFTDNGKPRKTRKKISQNAAIGIYRRKYAELCLRRIYYEVSNLEKEIDEIQTKTSSMRSNLEMTSQRIKEIDKELGNLKGNRKPKNTAVSSDQRRLLFQEREVLNKRLELIRGTIEIADSEIAQNEEKIRKLSAEDKQFAMKLFEEEYDLFCNNSMVEKVIVDGDSVDIFTVPLIMEYDKCKYLIGKFGIHFDSANNSVAFFNLDFPSTSCQHPHIDLPGNYCFGETGYKIPRLISEKLFFTAFQVAWSRMKKYYSGSKYNSIYDWPEYHPKKKVKA